MTRSCDLLGEKKPWFTLADFLPSSAEYLLPQVPQSVAIDMLVNSVMYVKHESHELPTSGEYDAKRWRYSWRRMRGVRSSDWDCFVEREFESRVAGNSQRRGRVFK